MDALQNADKLFAEALRRRPEVTVPTNASSPMDDRGTLVISQDLINSCEPLPDVTSRQATAFGVLDDVALAELDRAAAAERLEKVNQRGEESIQGTLVVDAEMAHVAAGLGWKRRRRVG